MEAIKPPITIPEEIKTQHELFLRMLVIATRLDKIDYESVTLPLFRAAFLGRVFSVVPPDAAEFRAWLGESFVPSDYNSNQAKAIQSVGNALVKSLIVKNSYAVKIADNSSR